MTGAQILNPSNRLPAAAENERDDTLAYLDRRIANAVRIATNSTPDSDTRALAVDRRQQLEVIRDELAQGMHVGLAAIAEAAE